MLYNFIFHHISAWVISSKFAASLQNTFSEEQLWRTASATVSVTETHSFLFFAPLHSYNSSIPLLYEDSTPYSLHSHPDSHHSHPDSPHSHLIPIIPTLIPRILIIPTLIPRIPCIPTLIPRIPCVPTLIFCISIIPLIPFPDSSFRLLQIA